MTWAIVLLLVALALLLLDLFIPSGGVLSVLSGLAMLGALVFAFTHGVWTGAAVLLFLIILIPVGALFAVRWWPHTPIGKRILIDTPVVGDAPGQTAYRHLLGKRGVAESKMVPAGAVRIDGRTYDAVSEGTFVHYGDTVEVISVDGNHLVVRQLSAEELQESREKSADPLSQPIEAIVPDPFDDPLA